jgi:hypothetical protein
MNKKKRSATVFTLGDIQKYVELASKKFIKYDRRLLEISGHEQAAAHRIGCYLKKYFPDWHVDCEYDRRGTVQKEMPRSGKTDRVRLDIIVHQRETKENLLCIETKKRSRPKKEFEEAKKRLCELTSPNRDYEYKYGLLITLIQEEPYVHCEWFQNGEIIHC